MSERDIVERLRDAHQTVPIPAIASLYSNAADEIKRLRAEVRGFQAESGCWQRWHDAERALTDQLADALRDEARNRTLRGSAARALDAHEEARRER